MTPIGGGEPPPHGRTCPRCGEGSLYAATISASGLHLDVCDECEATWLQGQPRSLETLVDLLSLMELLGLPEDYSLLVDEDRIPASNKHHKALPHSSPHEMTSEPRYCSVCLEGQVVRYLFVPTQEQLLVCEECDMTWPIDADASSDPTASYDQFATSRGYEDTWDHLLPVDAVE